MGVGLGGMMVNLSQIKAQRLSQLPVPAPSGSEEPVQPLDAISDVAEEA